MKNPYQPPDWRDVLSIELLSRAQRSRELQNALKEAQSTYTPWNRFKYLNIPDGFTHEEAWAFLKFTTRSAGEETPVRSISGTSFSFVLTKSLFERLTYIDTHGAGLIRTMGTLPTEAQASSLIMSGLTEEAIASSQIEGANTTHAAAKKMILSERKPRTKSEQMIINNYRAMQQVQEWKNGKLTEKMLLDLQEILVTNTMDDPSEAGRFRTDADDIVISDPLTGEVAHVPPKEKEMRSELQRLIKYANEDERAGEFVHPVIKASILHFWFAYLHPFTDGNGRSSRIIFHWYLLKRNYWLVQYLSVSKSILLSRKKYDDAYRHSECDDNDLTYFIIFLVQSFARSIDQFMRYFESKRVEEQKLANAATKIRVYNFRQLSLLNHFLRNEQDAYTDVTTHQNKHAVSHASAYNDLRSLVEAGLLTEMRRSKRLLYIPNLPKIKKLFG